MEDEVDIKFYKDLETEDDLGFILKAHLNIELQLVKFISSYMTQKEFCDWSKINYSAKLQLAMGFGLHKDLEKPLIKIGKIRNDFAHLLNHKFTDKDAISLFNGLEGTMIHRGVKHSFTKTLDRELKPKKESCRDLLTVILINLRQAIKAAYSD